MPDPQTDHDLLIELRTEMRGVRGDIQKLTDGTSGTLTDHETRIRSLEETRTTQQGRSGVFSLVGGFIYGTIGIIAGIIGSFIQAGKLF